MAVGIVMLQALAEYAGSASKFNVPRFFTRLTDQDMKFLIVALLALLFVVAVKGLSAKH